MAVILQQIPPLPDITTRMFDESGLMDPIWRSFFVRLLAGIIDPNVTLGAFADDAAAAAGGVQIGHLYRTASAVKVRVS